MILKRKLSHLTEQFIKKELIKELFFLYKNVISANKRIFAYYQVKQIYLWRNNKKRLPSSLAKPNEMAVFFINKNRFFT